MGAQGIPAKAAMTPRSTTDGPFCWQSKATLRAISESCGDRSDKALVLAVYLALSWEASNQQAERFTATKRAIAGLAGVSYQKAAQILKFLESIGVVEVMKNRVPGTKEQRPNTYTLGTTCLTPLGTSCSTLGTGSVQGSFAETIEESKKNLRRTGEEGRTSSAGADSAPAGDAVLIFPTSGKFDSWALTADFLAELTAAHPGLDVIAQCGLAMGKIKTGAVKRKTAQGMPRFLWSWMARANDAPQGTRQAATAAQPSREYRPI